MLFQLRNFGSARAKKMNTATVTNASQNLPMKEEKLILCLFFIFAFSSLVKADLYKAFFANDGNYAYAYQKYGRCDDVVYVRLCPHV